MSKLTTINTIYFIGVGGIGMSAIARYFLAKGAMVSGYDKTPTVLTNQLEKEGINIHYTDDITLAPQQPDVIVYTPAIPKDHQELNYFIDNGFTVMKRSDICSGLPKMLLIFALLVPMVKRLLLLWWRICCVIPVMVAMLS